MSDTAELKARIEVLEKRLEQHEPAPDCMSIWYMHDGHWFSSLDGSTLDELAADADAVRRGSMGAYGMLCAAILTKDGKEVRRIKWEADEIFGSRGHAGKPGNEKDDARWQNDLASWKEVHAADPEVMRLLSEGKIYRPKRLSPTA